MTLKARVKAGRLVLDEATDLPEGTEVELLPLDPGDWLDEDGRAALHQALKDSDEDVKAGRLVAADVILRELSVAVKNRRIRFTATAQDHVRRETAWWLSSPCHAIEIPGWTVTSCGPPFAIDEYVRPNSSVIRLR